MGLEWRAIPHQENCRTSPTATIAHDPMPTPCPTRLSNSTMHHSNCQWWSSRLWAGRSCSSRMCSCTPCWLVHWRKLFSFRCPWWHDRTRSADEIAMNSRRPIRRPCHSSTRRTSRIEPCGYWGRCRRPSPLDDSREISKDRSDRTNELNCCRSDPWVFSWDSRWWWTRDHRDCLASGTSSQSESSPLRHCQCMYYSGLWPRRRLLFLFFKRWKFKNRLTL